MLRVLLLDIFKCRTSPVKGLFYPHLEKKRLFLRFFSLRAWFDLSLRVIGPLTVAATTHSGSDSGPSPSGRHSVQLSRESSSSPLVCSSLRTWRTLSLWQLWGQINCSETAPIFVCFKTLSSAGLLSHFRAVCVFWHFNIRTWHDLVSVTGLSVLKLRHSEDHVFLSLC